MTCDHPNCQCPATWHYMPSDGTGDYCDEHVPRGCSCQLGAGGVPDTDDLGRLLPCCEWERDDDPHQYDSGMYR
jgi:hypothetical protein